MEQSLANCSRGNGSPDGKWIVSPSEDCTLKVWDAASGHDDRHTGRPSRGLEHADGFGDLQAVAAGHVHVQDDQVKADLLVVVECAFGVGQAPCTRRQPSQGQLQ